MTESMDVAIIENIPLGMLAVSMQNARRDLTEADDTSIADLAADIEQHGLLHPLTVRKGI